MRRRLKKHLFHVGSPSSKNNPLSGGDYSKSAHNLSSNHQPQEQQPHARVEEEISTPSRRRRNRLSEIPAQAHTSEFDDVIRAADRLRHQHRHSASTYHLAPPNPNPTSPKSKSTFYDDVTSCDDGDNLGKGGDDSAFAGDTLPDPQSQIADMFLEHVRLRSSFL